MSTIQHLAVRDRLCVSLPVLAACLSLAGVSSAHAADAADATTVSPLVVSANFTPTAADQVASSVTLITAQEIEARQERSLPDILRAVPGLNLIQSGGEGSTTSLFIRGANSNQTRVLIDGIDVSDPSTPNGIFEFGHFLSVGIQQVEVLRGPQSGLYGSDAIGGVVDVVTVAGSGPAHGGVSLEGGSFGTFNQTASVSGSLDRFSYALELAHLDTRDTPVTPLETLAPGEPRNGDRYDNVTVATKLGYRITDNFDVGVVARRINSDLHFTADFDFGAGPDPVQSSTSTRQLFTRAFAHLALFDDRFDQTVGYGFTDYRRLDLIPNTDPALNLGDRKKLDWQGRLTFSPDEILTLGAEDQQDEIRGSPISARMDNAAGYAQLQSSLGGRFFNTLSVRYDANDRFGGQTTYRVAPSYLIAETGTRLKASLGTGFKAPTLNELFVNFPSFFFFANPDLKPETSLGYDIGFEQTLKPWRVEFGATWFHNDIRNLITENATFSTDINVGRATTYGVESFIGWRPTDRLNLRADYTYLEARDDVARAPLIRRPKNKASVSATWQATKALSVTSTVLYVGSWIDGNRDFSATGLTAPGYATVDVAVNYDLPRGVSLFGRVSNLTEQHYQNPLGFLQPGLGVFAGAKAKF
jgi:vitamin B12 transporter